MNKKYLVIIILIAIIALIGGYFLLNNQSLSSESTTLILSQSAYMEVPNDANAKDNVDKKGIFTYVAMDGAVNVTSCSNLSADSSESEMNKLKNSFERGSKKIAGDNIVVYLKDGVYSVFVKNTQYNDTILLQSTNKNLLIQCWESIKFHSPTEKLKFNETPSGNSGSGDSGSVVNVVEKTKKAVPKSTSSSASSSTSSSSSSVSSSSSSYSSGFGYSSYGSSSSSSKSSKSSSKGGGGGSSTPSFGEF